MIRALGIFAGSVVALRVAGFGWNGALNFAMLGWVLVGFAVVRERGESLHRCMMRVMWPESVLRRMR